MHPLQNGSQAEQRPDSKPLSGLPGWFTESGDNNVPSYPGADWFNHVIAEFQNALAETGVVFDPENEDHLAQAFVHISNQLEAHKNSESGAHNASAIEMVQGVSVQDYLDKIPDYQPMYNKTNAGMIGVYVEEADVNNNARVFVFKKSPQYKHIAECLVTGRYSGGSSLDGSKCSAWRFGQIYPVPHLASYKMDYDFCSEVPTLATQSKSSWETASQSIKNGFRLNRISTNGSYFDFSISAEDSREVISIIFGSSTSSDNAATVEIFDKQDVLLKTEVVNCGGSNLDVFCFSTSNPRVSDDIKIRISKTSGTYLFVGGVNASMDGICSYDVDYISYYIDNTDEQKINVQTGAMDYAIQESSTQLFGGESHGGEDIISQLIYVDGEQNTLANGEYFSARSFSVYRETKISWSEGIYVDVIAFVNVGDGVSNFIGSFMPSEDFKARTAYLGMTTLHKSFSMMLTPKFYDSVDVVSGSDINIPVGMTNGFTVSKPNGKQFSSRWTSTYRQNLLVTPYWSLRPGGLDASKFYNAVAINSSEGVPLTNFSFQFSREIG